MHTQPILNRNNLIVNPVIRQEIVYSPPKSNYISGTQYPKISPSKPVIRFTVGSIINHTVIKAPINRNTPNHIPLSNTYSLQNLQNYRIP